MPDRRRSSEQHLREPARGLASASMSLLLTGGFRAIVCRVRRHKRKMRWPFEYFFDVADMTL
jgi:hypothetical protein